MLSNAQQILYKTTNMPIEAIKQLSDNEAWTIIYSKRRRVKKQKAIEICFTGFRNTEKSVLVDIARTHNFKVVSGVTLNLTYLCCGESPGPLKIQLAEEKNCKFLNQTDFLELVESGLDNSVNFFTELSINPIIPSVYIAR